MPRHQATPAAPERHLLDRRAAQLLAAERLPNIGHNNPPPDNPLADENQLKQLKQLLLTTKQLAEWL